MGIDVELRFKLPHELTEKEIRHLQFHLMHRFGKDMFWMDKEKNEMFISKDEENFYNIKLTKGETLYNIKTLCRYYGKGYERGRGHIWACIILFLYKYFPETTVYYGGDSDNNLEEYNKKDAYALLNLYLDSGNLPYVGGFDSIASDDIKYPTCEYCWVTMTRYGWGKRFAKFTCNGCGKTVEYKDEEFDKHKEAK